MGEKEKTVKEEDDSIYAEERRGRKLTTADKVLNLFWNWLTAYLILFAATVHVAFVIGGIIYLAVTIQKQLGLQ